tara:strand:- start:578 stop:793 length:216 start_codon:yes stop_codon:yes gene_type:complete
MKMREYVDEKQGDGAWDAMHDAIDRGDIFGWDMPPMDVDGRTVNIFPGENREATVEDVCNEIRRSLKQLTH